jgi:hypothetical protein
VVSSALGAGALVGGATALATGSLQKGIMAGLGAYGGAGLGSALAGTGASAMNQAAVDATLAANPGLTAGEIAREMGTAGFTAPQIAASANPATAGIFDKFGAGIKALGTQAGRTEFMKQVGGASGLYKAGMAAALPVMADQAVQTSTPMPGGQYQGTIRPYKFDPFTKQWTAQPTYPAMPVNTAPAAPAQSQEEQPPGGMAGGGIVALAAGGPSLPSDVGTYTPEQKADLYNKFLSQGFNDAAIRQAAGQQTDTDWQTLQQLAAQRGSPAVSGAERTVLTSPDWKSISGQTGIEGLNANIQNFVQQNPNIAYPQIAAAAQQYGVDTEDIRRAIAAGGGSGGLQNVLTQADWRSRTGLTGLEGMNKNIQMWVAENPQATEAQIRQAMQAVDINEADVMRATGKSVAELAYKPVTAVSPTVTTSPGGTTYTPAPLPEPVDFAPTTPTLAPATEFTPQTMEQVRTAYEQGGGATEMPTVTRLGPNERPMTQNAVVNSLQAYLANNPNATATEITAWGRANGVPDYQLRAAINERRFSMMTGGSKNAYDYLMGRGAYPTTPFVPGGGALMRPYSEVVGGAAGESAMRRYVPPKPTSQTAQSAGTTATNIGAGTSAQWQNVNTGEIKFAAPDTYVGDPSWRRLDVEATKQAEGGLSSIAAAGAAKGGQFNLGGYSDGGRLLRGPGDGVSDSIPATIGNRQPARLADGEFVIPARIVSEIGNGSTEAGARKLYAMMDRVQRARAKTTGKGKVAKNTRADKYLPA